MSGLWCEHFQQYGADSQLLDGVYADNHSGFGGGGTISSANPPRPGALSLLSNNAGDDYLRRIFGAAKTDGAGFGWRYYPPNLPGVDSNASGLHGTFFGFLTAGGLIQVGVFLGSDGGLIGVRGGGLTVIHRVSPCITARTWQGVEMKCVPDDTAGTFEVRVNGSTVFNYTGNTDPNGTGEVSQALWIRRAQEQIADLHAWDTIGGNGPTDFVGNVGVLRRELTADTAQADWTLSTGSTGYSLLIDKSDASNIVAANVDDKSAFSAGALPAGATGILYQQVMFRGLKTDAADCDVAPSMISGSDETDVTGQHMTETETWRWGVFANDPATSAPWALAAANASQAVVTRTA